jgi:hypothetical protein
MVVAVSEDEYQLDFGVTAARGHWHEGYVEVSNGQVIGAELMIQQEQLQPVRRRI